MPSPPRLLLPLPLPPPQEPEQEQEAVDVLAVDAVAQLALSLPQLRVPLGQTRPLHVLSNDTTFLKKNDSSKKKIKRGGKGKEKQTSIGSGEELDR